ncbi:hypothetical protein K440DRAFT_526810, partial [Wilcoxina mikolae CBS 423.85]
AAEWRNISQILFPIYLKDLLPACDYEYFINHTLAIEACLRPYITMETITDIRLCLLAFIKYYEKQYYGFSFERIAACLPVFHQFAHVANFLQFCGP